MDAKSCNDSRTKFKNGTEIRIILSGTYIRDMKNKGNKDYEAKYVFYFFLKNEKFFHHLFPNDLLKSLSAEKLIFIHINEILPFVFLTVMDDPYEFIGYKWIETL